MSVLLHLPNELFYQIVIEWLDPSLFLAFTHLDNAVKYNSNLRLILLNHYEANRRNIQFERSGGYYCSSSWEIIRGMKYIPSFVGIRAVVKTLDLAGITRYMTANGRIMVESLLNACIMTELILRRDDVIKTSYNYGLSFLKILSIDYKYDATLEGCLCIKNSCTKFKKFTAGSAKARASLEVRQVLNEIVANNNNLEYLTVFTTNDIFNILPVNCKQLLEVTLYIDEAVAVKRIYDLLQALPLMTRLALHTSPFDCEWKNGDICQFENGSTYNIKETSLHWTYKRVNEAFLNDVVTYFASTTTSLEINLSLNLSNVDVQSLQRTMQYCNNLTAIEIYTNVSKNDWIDIFQPVAFKLQKLTAHYCNVSMVINILKCCRNLTIADFWTATDDSIINPWIVEGLRETLTQYPNQSIRVFLKFRSSCFSCVTYIDRKLTGHHLNDNWIGYCDEQGV